MIMIFIIQIEIKDFLNVNNWKIAKLLILMQRNVIKFFIKNASSQQKSKIIQR
jgi:hypothetical protein